MDGKSHCITRFEFSEGMVLLSSYTHTWTHAGIHMCAFAYVLSAWQPARARGNLAFGQRLTPHQRGGRAEVATGGGVRLFEPHVFLLFFSSGVAVAISCSCGRRVGGVCHSCAKDEGFRLEGAAIGPIAKRQTRFHNLPEASDA